MRWPFVHEKTENALRSTFQKTSYDNASRRRWLATAFSWLDQNEKWVLSLPAVIFVVLILGFPLVFTLGLSLFRWFASSLTAPRFIGLQNYVDMISDVRMWQALGRSIYFVVLAVGAEVVLGVLIALLFNYGFIGRGIARTLFQLSFYATPTAMSMVWMMLFNPVVGPLSYYLNQVGIVMTWIADPRWVIPSLVLVDIWRWTPLIMMMALAGLAALPVEPYEAARIDGASGLQMFWLITLPLLRPTVVVAAMFRIIDALKTFDIIMVITQGGPGHASEILNVYAFDQLFTGFHFGYGSALLTLLGIIVFGATVVMSRVRRSL